ncbi:hypothetical protein GIB67_027374 [Kingdonia uniflora]|uniref:Uncharacterized protein n=1 Tax=Kingdonia uniflora TaxID=39325 RepID=A0A7J7MF79_9MAGN|nr:hypothetical protein GIB67_027374 [Kingdonia uniflora]
MEGEIITLGESSWRPLDIPYIVNFSNDIAAKFSNGSLHWVINKVFHQSGTKRILVLDISSEKFRTIDLSFTISCENGLYLVKCGESLALVNSVLQEHIRICKISGNNTNVYKTHKKTHKIPVIPKGTVITNYRTLGFWGNETLLLRLCHSHTNNRREEKINIELALYRLKMKELRAVDISGVPSIFRTSIFTPSLISPRATISSGLVPGNLK